jgi:hypothetical protein
MGDAGEKMDMVDTLEARLNSIMNSEIKVHNKSKYDSMKRDNDDITLDTAVANNGGKFSVCNLSLLEA